MVSYGTALTKGMVVPANLAMQMVSYGTYFLDYGRFSQYQTSRREGTQGTQVMHGCRVEKVYRS